MRKKNAVGSWIVAVIVVLAMVAAGVYLARKATTTNAPATTPADLAQAGSVAGAAAPSIRHPISQASAPANASTAALPQLSDSDASVASALASLAGTDGLQSLLVQQQIIPRIVATIDALPRRGLGTFMLPAHTPKGDFITTPATDGGMVMSERNAARYAPYMQIVDRVDAKALVAWYVHAYPLFQEAYRQLGYPKGYFNDRLIVVIDNLLATPELAQPAVLVPAAPFYKYVAPSLESLSAGQKLLIRTGPANEARIKAKLRAIRAQLLGQVLPAASSSAGTGR